MLVVVTKDKHTHDCTSEAQLNRFLKAGWTKSKKQPKQDQGETPEQKEPEQTEG